jgi:hypothetical protein
VSAVLLDDLIFLSHQVSLVDRYAYRRKPWIAGMGGIVDEAGCLDQVISGRGGKPSVRAGDEGDAALIIPRMRQP